MNKTLLIESYQHLFDNISKQYFIDSVGNDNVEFHYDNCQLFFIFNEIKQNLYSIEAHSIDYSSTEKAASDYGHILRKADKYIKLDFTLFNHYMDGVLNIYKNNCFSSEDIIKGKDYSLKWSEFPESGYHIVRKCYFSQKYVLMDFLKVSYSLNAQVVLFDKSRLLKSQGEPPCFIPCLWVTSPIDNEHDEQVLISLSPHCPFMLDLYDHQECDLNQLLMQFKSSILVSSYKRIKNVMSIDFDLDFFLKLSKDEIKSYIFLAAMTKI